MINTCNKKNMKEKIRSLLPLKCIYEITKQNFERKRERESEKEKKRKKKEEENDTVKKSNRTFIQIDSSSGSLTHAD